MGWEGSDGAGTSCLSPRLGTSNFPIERDGVCFRFELPTQRFVRCNPKTWLTHAHTHALVKSGSQGAFKYFVVVDRSWCPSDSRSQSPLTGMVASHDTVVTTGREWTWPRVSPGRPRRDNLFP